MPPLEHVEADKNALTLAEQKKNQRKKNAEGNYEIKGFYLKTKTDSRPRVCSGDSPKGNTE